jgi:hypothetical protein
LGGFQDGEGDLHPGGHCCDPHAANAAERAALNGLSATS